MFEKFGQSDGYGWGNCSFFLCKENGLCIWGKTGKRGLSDEGERKSGKIGILFGAGYGY